MKIQENLVWDKHSGELIVYVDFEDFSLNYAARSKVEEIATCVLVFLIRSIFKLLCSLSNSVWLILQKLEQVPHKYFRSYENQ